METTSWGAGTRSFPKHHQRFPSTTKTAEHLLLNPPGVWIAQGAWPRERLCGEVGIWYGVWRMQQVLVGRNGKHHWIYPYILETVSDQKSHQNNFLILNLDNIFKYKCFVASPKSKQKCFVGTPYWTYSVSGLNVQNCALDYWHVNTLALFREETGTTLRQRRNAMKSVFIQRAKKYLCLTNYRW